MRLMFALVESVGSLLLTALRALNQTESDAPCDVLCSTQKQSCIHCTCEYRDLHHKDMIV